jgi:hypothetical protein
MTNFADALKSLENVITVATEGGDFTTLKDALDSITDSSPTQRYTVQVAPGIYTEDNPIQGKEYVAVKAIGDLQTTRFVAGNINTDLLIMANLFTIEGVALWGVSGATNYAIRQDVVGSTSVTRCIFGECTNGIIVNNAGTQLVANDIAVFNPTVTLVRGAYCQAGIFNVYSMNANAGTLGTMVEITGVNSSAVLNNVNSSLSTLTTGISVKDLASVDINFPKLTGMATAIEAEGGAHVHFNGVRIEGATVDGVRINNVGTDTILNVQTTIVENSTGFDFNLLSATCQVSGNASTSINKLNFVAGAKLYGTILDLEEGDEGVNVIGELHVGIPEQGAESVFGEGDSYTRGLIAYTYNGANDTYTDISAAVQSPTASTFTFPNNSINTAIYVSTDLQAADYLKFFGLKMANTVSQIGGTIVGEYWNGAWVAFTTMTAESSGSYLRKADDLFTVAPNGYQIRFNPTMDSDWVKNDDPAVDATNRYWVRFRITASPATLPVFEQFKIHTNRHEINADGFGEDMGKARAYKTVPVSWNTFKDAGSTVGNQDLWLTTNCKTGFSNNIMGTGDSVGTVTSLPAWVDTSARLRLKVSGVPVATGNYTLTAFLNSSLTGDVISSNNPGSVVGEVSQAVLVAGVATQQAWWIFDLNISDKGVETLASNPESIWINVETTTVAGNLDGMQFEIEMLNWRDGEHI